MHKNHYTQYTNAQNDNVILKALDPSTSSLRTPLRMTNFIFYFSFSSYLKGSVATDLIPHTSRLTAIYPSRSGRKSDKNQHKNPYMQHSYIH